ncbi:MAG TPA: ABC transporter permease [Actinomycetes bacterium]|jgi:ABC-2 type transport system permease protein|nr:ABC transporter permease [Actinomycetes bacterium]
MSARVTFATARRVLHQLRHDRRTLAMLLLVPCILISLLAWLFSDSPEVFDRIGPALLGIFPFITMFLVTSVATLRERTSGTLERLLTMPMHKLDLLVGYALAFGVIAMLQALLAAGLALWVLGLDVAGPAWAIVLVAVADALLGMALGLLVSAFASSEFQAVQFLPAVILPQFLLCGLLVQRDAMPSALSAISDWLPLSYAVDAMGELSRSPDFTGAVARNVIIVAGCALAALALGAVTLRRRTA